MQVLLIVKDVVGYDLKEAPRIEECQKTLVLLVSSSDFVTDEVTGPKILSQTPEVTGILEYCVGRRFICFVCDDRNIYPIYWLTTDNHVNDWLDGDRPVHEINQPVITDEANKSPTIINLQKARYFWLLDDLETTLILSVIL